MFQKIARVGDKSRAGTYHILRRDLDRKYSAEIFIFNV